VKRLVLCSSILVLALTALSLFGQESKQAPLLRSSRLLRLESELYQGNATATESFWREVEKQTTPLIEPIPGDQAHMWVTFLWRAKQPVQNVLVLSGLSNYSYGRSTLPNNLMSQLPETDVWYKTYRVRADSRFTYQLSVNDSLIPQEDEQDENARFSKFQADPLNPRRSGDATNKNKTENDEDTESFVELPQAPAQPWLLRAPGVPTGKLAAHQLKSEILQNERRVQVYTPYQYDPHHSYPLLILMDGNFYTGSVPTPTILDNLIAQNKIRPVVAVFVDNPATNQLYLRTLELSCYAPFTRFLAQELIPWVRKRYSVTSNATDTVVGGVSRGGLAAACAALERPELFGNVSSQSGFFVYKDRNWFKRVAPNSPSAAESQEEEAWSQYGTVMHEFAASRSMRHIRVYLDVGIYENDFHPSMLTANRHLRDVLIAKNYEIKYQEFVGNHNAVNWRGTFPDALMFLLGNDTARQTPETVHSSR
jgi:enterochelin esterase-like enzyme